MTGIDPERASRLIREQSTFAVHDIEPLGQGFDSAAFRVDRDWVVRFPLVPRAQSALRRELALLPELARRLPVAVPRPEHVAHRDGRIVFSAYRLLEGEPLSDAALAALAPRARERTLDEFAALLRAIDHFPLRQARAAGVTFELYAGAYHDAQRELELQLRENLGADELATIARQRGAFARSRLRRERSTVLLHADIKPEHLLHDPASGRLTGLIDWGDASLGHADFDLAIAGAFCGPETLRGLLARLSTADAARARAGLPFMLTIRWLQDLAIVARTEDDRLTESVRRRLLEHLRATA
jgi:aminoglycoside phosphotransferase (APT) family kinase protein